MTANSTTTQSAHRWISGRARSFASGGIRQMFQLAAQLKNPVNLAIGQADFEVPLPIKNELKRAIDENHNDYALAQGIPELRSRLQAVIEEETGLDSNQHDRQVFVTSGTSAGLTLACLSLIDPGDEVVFFDPYFALYPALVQLAGGIPLKVDTYPDFRIDPAKLEDAITARTKMIIINSPANPTGCCLTERELAQISELAIKHNIVLVSDEIYSTYSYDQPHRCAAEFNPATLVINGFSKSHAMAGLRLAYVHGPSEIIESMIQLQQFTFVCAPHPVQWAGLSVLESDTSEFVAQYQKKRDWLIDQLGRYYEITIPSKDNPGGAFYLFPKLPWGTGREFFDAALDENLILIPGTIFSDCDSHFRISYAISDNTMQQGTDLLIKLAKRRSKDSD